MRKIKITALILAVLMVMAAFAGCASKSTVEDLDDRVSALEGKIDANQKANEESISELADLIAALTQSQTNIKDSVDANKAAQDASNKAILDAIKDLTNKVTEVEKEQEEAGKTDDVDTALQAAVKVYTAKLQELKIACELDKDAYVPADYAKVVKALGDAIAAIAEAKTAAEVETLYNEAKAVYDANATVYSRLVAYYGQVKNAVTKDSKALIDEIKLYINGDAANDIVSPVTIVYGATPASNALLNYKNGDLNEDGTPVVINLYSAVKAATGAYDYLVSVAFTTLVEKAIADIDAIGTVLLSATAKVTTAAASNKAVVDAVADNKVGAHAAYLADSNVALVTNAATLKAAQDRLGVLVVAQAMYATIGQVTASEILSPFAEYKNLTTKVDYTEKAKYDAINATLKSWIDQYALDADNIEYIIDAKEVAGFYDAYVANDYVVALYAAAAKNFAAIDKRIQAMNKVTALNATTFTEYKDISDAIDAWKIVREKDDTAKPAITEIKLDDYNFKKILAEYKYVKADKSAITEADLATDAYKAATMYSGLYAFVDANAAEFFGTTFLAAAVDADAINAAIKSLALVQDKLTSIESIVKLEGAYALVTGKTGLYAETKVTYDKVSGAYTYTNVKNAAEAVEDADAAAMSVAEFKAKYVTDAYDLSVLLNTADLAAVKAAVATRIAGFKTEGDKIEELIAAVDAVLVSVDASGNYVAYDETNGKYLVTLADAAAIEAAQDAYDAWVAAGANSSVKDFVAFVDADEKVVDGYYVFGDIIDTEAVNVLKSMNSQIVNIKKIETALKNYYKLTKDAHEAGINKLTVSNIAKKATTSKVTETHEYQGTTTITYKGIIYNTTIVSGITVKSVKTSGAKSNEDDFLTYTTLLENTFALYDAFMAANTEYYYDAQGALKDKEEKSEAVETAKATNAAFELIYVKAETIAALKNIKKEVEKQPDYDQVVLDAIDVAIANVTNAANATQIQNFVNELKVSHNLTIAAADVVKVGKTVVIE